MAPIAPGQVPVGATVGSNSWSSSCSASSRSSSSSPPARSSPAAADPGTPPRGAVRAAQDDGDVPEQERQGPHPFLWLLAVALVPALVAAALAPDRAPAVALYWNPIYRAEIALVVLAVAYLLAVVGWMAWHGQAFRRIELPGGTALERDTAELDEAANDFDGFQ